MKKDIVIIKIFMKMFVLKPLSHPSKMQTDALKHRDGLKGYTTYSIFTPQGIYLVKLTESKVYNPP